MPGSGPAAARPAQPLPHVPVDVAPGLTVLRRASWGADLPAPADLPTEAPGDVRVLLVHHSASTNDYGDGAAADQIRQFHTLHTGPEKGWPDVAYNFFVDRFGRVWEGRSGSIDGPVIGDATGGNQGFSQLVCLIGDFVSDEPTPEALDALVRVLAWLGQREGVDVTPGATASFPSRGRTGGRRGSRSRPPRSPATGTCRRPPARAMPPTPTCAATCPLWSRPMRPATAPTTARPTAPPSTAPPTTTPATSPTTPRPDGVAAPVAAGRDGDDGPTPALLGGVAVTVAAAATALAVRLRGRRPPSAPR